MWTAPKSLEKFVRQIPELSIDNVGFPPQLIFQCSLAAVRTHCGTLVGSSPCLCSAKLIWRSAAETSATCGRQTKLMRSKRKEFRRHVYSDPCTETQNSPVESMIQPKHCCFVSRDTCDFFNWLSQLRPDWKKWLKSTIGALEHVIFIFWFCISAFRPTKFSFLIL